MAQKIWNRILEGFLSILLALMASFAISTLGLTWDGPGSAVFADWTYCIPSFFVIGMYARVTRLNRQSKEPLSLAMIAMVFYLCQMGFWWMIGAVMPLVVYSGHPFAWAAGICSLAVYGIPAIWLVLPVIRLLKRPRI